VRPGATADVRRAGAEFAAVTADFYRVPACGIRVLAGRPLRVREHWATELLFGDYNPSSMLIREWMTTALRKEITSSGKFLSTPCHEFCHHLDHQGRCLRTRGRDRRRGAGERGRNSQRVDECYRDLSTIIEATATGDNKSSTGC
jgi:hypothetical protein